MHWILADGEVADRLQQALPALLVIACASASGRVATALSSYADGRITKVDLARYYEAVADWVLPYVADRPLTLVRCPDGSGGQCFYQKHWTDSLPEAVGSVRIQGKSATEPYVVIDDLAGLISLVQISTLELHPWSARTDRPLPSGQWGDPPRAR